MSDVKFRATVKHDGAEVGNLSWLEEFWAVRYGDYAALQDRIAALEAQRDEAVKALIDLERCSTRVNENRAAQFGSQWMKLSLAIGAARFVLEKMQTPDEPKRTTLAKLTGGKDE